MAKETSFSAMLSARKLGASVTQQFASSLDMLGTDMTQGTQNITTAASALTLGAIAGVPSKLLIVNLEPATYQALSGAPAIAGGGTGYTVGDVLTLVGGTGIGATVTVATISGGGGTGPITAVTLTTAGKYLTVPSTPNGPSGGTGTGASLTLAFATFNGSSVSFAGDAGMTNMKQTLPPGDLILLSPTSATIYAKAASGTVQVFKVATAA